MSDSAPSADELLLLGGGEVRRAFDGGRLAPKGPGQRLVVGCDVAMGGAAKSWPSQQVWGLSMGGKRGAAQSWAQVVDIAGAWVLPKAVSACCWMVQVASRERAACVRARVVPLVRP